MIRRILIVFLSLIIFIPLAAEENDTLLADGIEALRRGSFESAAKNFKTVLGDEQLIFFHSDALYWLVSTEINLRHYREAARYAGRFIKYYSDDERIMEIRYHQARLYYFLGKPLDAFYALQYFIEQYPNSSLLPSSLYWMGEVLFALNRIPEADEVFAKLLEEYPYSVKREAARYRRNEIALLQRESFHNQKIKNVESLLAIKEKLLEMYKFYSDELVRINNES